MHDILQDPEGRTHVEEKKMQFNPRQSNQGLLLFKIPNSTS